MEKFIVLRLLRLLWNKIDLNKSIVGMCHEHYRLKSNYFFLEGRPKRLNVSIALSHGSDYMLQKNGTKCTFISADSMLPTALLSYDMSEGLFSWRVKINYCDDVDGENGFYMGAVTSGLSDGFGLGLCATGCTSFRFFKSELGILRSELCGFEDQHLVPDNSFVTMELNCDSRTLVFFINSQIIPIGMCGLVLPLRFGMSGENGASFDSLSFILLSRSIPMRVECQYYHTEALVLKE